jgi:hypothetical protein
MQEENKEGIMQNVTQEQITIVSIALLAVSEALSLIPAIKANGVFQAIFNVIKIITGKK